MAIKTDRGQLVQLAFEVQWSPQTLEETNVRQAKYQRDGIRCCWLFRQLPTSHDIARQDLPMFKLSLQSKDVLMVNASTRTMKLSEFIAALLSRYFKVAFRYQVCQNQQLKAVFFPVSCWKCQQKHYLYYIENPCYYSCCDIKINELLLGALDNNFAWFKPEIIQAVQNFLKTEAGQKIRMGEIKIRYSDNIMINRISFGCPQCDTLAGEGFNIKKYFDPMCRNKYPDIPIIKHDLQITLPNPVLSAKPHWCYSKTGSFCD
ncbi:hypothetical protein [Kamptonema sp. UHCC 0994]|uniref:hypothetical protein n=1 Tax=Kamptonema sp. UHCC 0994 TaxID=3031329 RepID=UPI0023B99B3D|nr:hypothetical protein [Kamptonema sp. UHCC 0994]